MLIKFWLRNVARQCKLPRVTALLGHTFKYSQHATHYLCILHNFIAPAALLLDMHATYQHTD